MSGLTPERRATLYIEDALKYSRHAIEFLGDRDDADLERDLRGQFAIVRALEVVGEALRCIPEELRKLAPEVPWREVIAMRNRIVHHYFGVRLDVVLNVVRQDLPPLIESMERLLLKISDS
jgi:uncharacterized protein with HEPN domain